MNYRHSFHAGNFAEVIKHAVLARVIAHLQEKPGGLRILDTHAGPGVTELTGRQASRTGEWRDGIGRLIEAPLGEATRALLAPYLQVIAAFNPDARLVAYPGSPALARAWLRPQDRLIACELEPSTLAQLRHHLRGDRRAKVIEIDGWTALGAYLPPPQRRGVVLIDPPFEAPGEFGRLADGLLRAHRKWATGIYLLWYPIKSLDEAQSFGRRLAGSRIPGILRAEVTVGPGDTERLSGTGLIMVNPPWTLEGELKIMLPELAAALSNHQQGRAKLEWIAGEK